MPNTPLPPTQPTQANRPYNNYSEVPYYRKQWFFWVMYFTLTPVALGLLLFGNIYYNNRGEVKAFGMANKIVAGIIGVFYLLRVFSAFAK